MDQDQQDLLVEAINEVNLESIVNSNGKMSAKDVMISHRVLHICVEDDFTNKGMDLRRGTSSTWFIIMCLRKTGEDYWHFFLLVQRSTLLQWSMDYCLRRMCEFCPVAERFEFHA